MKGYRNKTIIIVTLLVDLWVAVAGVHAGSDLIGLATVIGAINAGSVGAIFGRGYNKKHAPEQ